MKRFIAQHNGEDIEFFIERLDNNQLKIVTDGKERIIDVTKVGFHHYSVLENNESHDLRFYHDGKAWQGFLQGEHVYFNLKDDKAIRREQSGGAMGGGSGTIVAPMPGKVVKIKVTVGQQVKAGEGVVVVEAMKMENEFKSTVDGTVKDIKAKEGESVESGAVLVEIEPVKKEKK